MAAALPSAPARVWWILGFLVLALGAVVVWTVREPQSRPATTPLPAGSRLWTARTLAAEGAPVRDIARRTGMAQEAVALALNLAGAVPDGSTGARRVRDASPESRRPRARRMRSAGGEAQRLAWELTDGVRKLQDGRLTYGARR